MRCAAGLADPLMDIVANLAGNRVNKEFQKDLMIVMQLAVKLISIVCRKKLGMFVARAKSAKSTVTNISF
jgi:hypothetical protein